MDYTLVCRDKCGELTSEDEDVVEMKVLNFTGDLSTFSKYINVEKLHLEQSHDITGFDSFPKLKFLDATCCRHINDEQFANIATISTLEKLRIHDTNITDLSPISNLTNLRELKISDPAYNSTDIALDLSFLQHLTKLEKLYLSSMAVTNISYVSKLIHLKVLGVSSLSGDFSMDILRPLVNLEDLQLDNLNITSIDCSTLTKLESLDLCNLEGFDISSISNITWLDSLNLFGTEVSDLSYISKLTNLRQLYVENCSVSDISPLCHMILLEELSLATCSVSDISPLCHMTLLQELNLIGLSIDDMGVIGCLPSIKTVQLPSFIKGGFAALYNVDELFSFKGLDVQIMTDDNNIETYHIACPVEMSGQEFKTFICEVKGLIDESSGDACKPCRA